MPKQTKAEKAAYHAAYYRKNKQRLLANQNEYYQTNKTKVLKRLKKQRNTPESRKARAASRRKYFSNPKNKLKHKLATQKWVAANYEKNLATKRAAHARRMRNPALRQRHQRKKAVYMRERAKRDPNFRMRLRHSSRIKDAFLRQNINKPHSADKLIGCTWEEFRTHLQKQYRDGMTDENYGQVWELDHIQPCSGFDLTDPEQVKVCFNYSNYQPLLVSENRRKSDKGRRRIIIHPLPNG